jgi:hypothetical protein
MKIKARYSKINYTLIDQKDPWQNFLITDKDFLKVRKRYTNEFMDKYKQGFEFFIQGKWEIAKKLFEMSNYLIDENDYITIDIISFMSMTQFIPLENWDGARRIKDILK